MTWINLRSTKYKIRTLFAGFSPGFLERGDPWALLCSSFGPVWRVRMAYNGKECLLTIINTTYHVPPVLIFVIFRANMVKISITSSFKAPGQRAGQPILEAEFLFWLLKSLAQEDNLVLTRQKWVGKHKNADFYRNTFNVLARACSTWPAPPPFCFAGSVSKPQTSAVLGVKDGGDWARGIWCV